MHFQPHPYQARAIDHILYHPYCALWLQMGLGKTVCTLTAIHMLKLTMEVNKVLIIAPKSVAQNTWTDECSKWEHLKDMRVSVVMGSASEREKALHEEADLYVTNRDNATWLVEKIGKKWEFDCLVLDEASSFKSPQAKRWKALKKIRPYISRLIELTGTPAPNGLEDLWAQLYLLDQGERLGKTITSFRSKYFSPGRGNGHVVYDYRPKPGTKEELKRITSDICLPMRTEDFISLPTCQRIITRLSLSPSEMKKYKSFAKDYLMELDGEVIEATQAAALTNKLLQFTAGSIYNSSHEAVHLNDVKADALSELIEQTDEPILVFYAYQHELERYRQLDGAVVFTGEPDILKRWNAGKIKILLCHPASVAYGLNMQQGGHIIVWTTPTWSLEMWQQANARLHRQGQTKPVLIYTLTCPGTMDQRVLDALDGKTTLQDALMQERRTLWPD